MTASQALRAERRRRRALAERERRSEVMKAIVAIALVLAAYCLVGTLEYEDRVRDLSGSTAGTEWDARWWLNG